MCTCVADLECVCEDTEAWPGVFYSLCRHSLQVYSPVETADRTCYMPLCSAEIIHVWFYLTVLTTSVRVCVRECVCV